MKKRKGRKEKKFHRIERSYGARIRFQYSENQTQDRRFPGAALANDDQALLRRDSQRHMIEHLFIAAKRITTSHSSTTCRVDVVGGSGVSKVCVIGWSAIRETCLSFAFQEKHASRACDLFS